MEHVLNLAGRVLLAHIFLLSGINKITGYVGTAGYMASKGVPELLLPVVIAIEIGGALMLILGWKARWAALALAAFSVVAGLLFHFEPGNQMQTINLMKNLAIAGGLLIVVRAGPGRPSLDDRGKRLR